MQARRPATVLKETPTKVFFCEYCEHFKNTYFQDILETTASFYWYFFLRASLCSSFNISLLFKVLFKFQRVLFGVISGRLLSYSKKRRISRNDPLCHLLSLLSLVLPLAVTRCHLLSLIVPFAVTRCHSMYHSSVFL